MAKRASAALSRDERDILTVARALLKGASLPEDRRFLDRYLSRDLDRFKAAFGQRSVSLEILPPLLLRSGYVIRLGGGGIVFQCSNADIPAINYALKVLRPSLIGPTFEKASEEFQRTTAEFLRHAPLSHENIARVFGASQVVVEHSGVKVVMTAILMEWIPDPLPFSEYLIRRARDYRQVIDLLHQALEGLSHLHAQKLIHWDIKSDNLLVDGSGTLKITDLGNARRMDDPDRGSLAFSTRANVPPAIQGAPATGDQQFSSRRTPVELPSLDWDSPWLDLWMLAKDLNSLFKAEPALLPHEGNEVLAESEDFRARCFLEKDENGVLALRILTLILRRLLFPKTPAEPRFYSRAQEVALDLDRLTPEFGAAQSVPELRAVPQGVMRLPRTGNAPFTTRFGRVFNSRTVQRLSGHLQLGTLAHVYPGATHRRSEHVAGVAAMAIQFIRALFADRSSPFWRLSVDARDVRATILASLLHDVGHIAYGHFLEEMTGLFRGRTHDDYVLALLDPARVGELPYERETS